MKTAIYIESGVTQLVLTPETDFEKAALRALDRESQKLTIYRGQFYECQGGWWRQGGNPDESLILRLNSETQQPNTPIGDTILT